MKAMPILSFWLSDREANTFFIFFVFEFFCFACYIRTLAVRISTAWALEVDIFTYILIFHENSFSVIILNEILHYPNTKHKKYKHPKIFIMIKKGLKIQFPISPFSIKTTRIQPIGKHAKSDNAIV